MKKSFDFVDFFCVIAAILGAFVLISLILKI